jgi:acetyl-CoA carboxylase carboxyltransferase component
VNVSSPLAGVVVDVLATEGEPVVDGAPVLVVESMKMHHEVFATASGVVREVAVGVGDQVAEGQPVLSIEPGEPADVVAPAAEGRPAGGELRRDLAEALERRRTLTDEERSDAVLRRHETGLRTARENVAALCDPDTFSEYGGLAIAAQRARRSLDDLIANTPGDGIVTGIGVVNGDVFGAGARCAVLAYDYTVLAGTQGVRGHRKADRMIELAGELELPLVLFAEGGGGRPGDTDRSELFHLDVPTFHGFASLSGLVPRIGVVSGRCFAGNAALLGCCDVIIATPDATIGMGGPAMIEGGGLGSFEPEQVGPVDVLEPNGVIDVVASDDAEAVSTARRCLAYFQGPVADWTCADQALLRSAVPEDPKRSHDVRALIELLADDGSVLELRPRFGRTIVTALARIEGRPVGILANDPRQRSGAIDSDGSDKGARFVQLCDAFGLPIVSLVDTPGFMVGPESEAEAAVRHCSRLFIAGSTASVPFVSVVVRRAFGLGAQAMTGGGFHVPALNVSWPSGEFGAMGVEGAVKLALRRELEAIDDADERARRVAEVAGSIRDQSGALNMAAHFEIDDVIDPAETRDRIVATLGSLPPAKPGRRRTMVDAW